MSVADGQRVGANRGRFMTQCRSGLKITWITGIFLFTIFTFGCQKDVGAGPAAPDFSLPDLSGKMVTLKQYRGKIIILDFWATWCPPCRAAIPELVKLQKKYRDRGLIVLGISVDDKRSVDNAYLRSFGKQFNINYSILRYNLKVIEAYFGREAPALPTIYVIDRQGQLRDKFVGFNPDGVRNSLERLFK